MAMTLGGRAAEEIVFGEITTGASNDLEKVTATAKQMVMRFGMSEKLGPRVFGHDHGQPFLGREFSAEPDYSDEIAREIDDEIRRIVEAAHQRAKDILTEHRDVAGRRSPRSSSSARRSRRSSSRRCSPARPRKRSSASRGAAAGPGRARRARAERPAARPRARCPAPAGRGGVEARGLDLPRSPSSPDPVDAHGPASSTARVAGLVDALVPRIIAGLPRSEVAASA